MNNPWRRALAAAIILASCLGTGCNLALLPMLLFGPEPKMPPKLKKLASDDKKKEVKVVLLAYNGLETRPELIQADRQLCELLAKSLKEQFKANEENVTIVPPRKVEEYKNNHPDWHRDLDLVSQVGRHFKADYVIHLEINSLTLFDKGSVNQLYRGNTQIDVSVVDVNKPDESPEHETFSHLYPSEGKGPVPVGDVTQEQFRHAFLTAVAKKLSWYFTGHATQFEYDVN